MLKKAILVVSLCISGHALVKGQVVNNGQKIFIDNNALVFVDNNYKHLAGNIVNNGKMKITGDWFNNDLASTVFDIRSAGLTDLAGGSQQIGGSNKTSFSDLNLSGSGNKTLAVNTDITKNLFLNDKELKTGAYTLSVLNPLSESISRTTGFISTDKQGKLMRNTNTANSYLFPLGSSLYGTSIYRPVSVEPLNADLNTYSIAFLNENPSGSGYNTSDKRQDIDRVFDDYFYILNQESGSSAINAKFYQDATDEDEFAQLVSWNNAGVWEKAAPSTVSNGNFGDGLNRSLLFKSAGTLKNLPVTFASASKTGDALTFFNGFSPDGDGKNDRWLIKNIDLFPDNELTVYNRWGDEVFKEKGYSSTNAWDGSNMNQGTYFYVLKVTINDTQELYKGFITILKKE
jgi:gliding motility-associated-like protein